MRSILLLFAFCLITPAVALADNPVGELAPGFYVCTEQARTTDFTVEEYKRDLSTCIDKAEKYWEPLMLKKWMTEHGVNEYNGMGNSEKGDLLVYRAWFWYKKAGSDLIRAEGNELRARIFEVEEARRYARTHGVVKVADDDNLEYELSPEYNQCRDGSLLKKGKISGNISCEKLALNYWNNVLLNNYEMYKALYQDNHIILEKLERFQSTWKKYLEAIKQKYRLSAETPTANREDEIEAWEVKRQALLFESLRSLR